MNRTKTQRPHYLCIALGGSSNVTEGCMAVRLTSAIVAAATPSSPSTTLA
jgi:hypothetical protein